MEKKTVLILAGASAAGKTTVAYEIIRRHPHFELSRSATTRAPRGDGNDNEYIYFSSEEFRAAIASGDMLEHTEFAGNCYGTTKREIKRIFDEGKIPLLILDTNGVDSIKRAATDFDVCAVYVYASLFVLEKRLYDRYLTPPTADGLKSFIKRRDGNVEYYASAGSWAHLFEAYVENLDLEESVKNTLEAYSGNLRNTCPEEILKYTKCK